MWTAISEEVAAEFASLEWAQQYEADQQHGVIHAQRLAKRAEAERDRVLVRGADAIRETRMAAYAENVEYNRARAAEWREANRTRVRENLNTWRAENREAVLAQRRAYREANREKIREDERRRRAARKVSPASSLGGQPALQP